MRRDGWLAYSGQQTWTLLEDVAAVRRTRCSDRCADLQMSGRPSQARVDVETFLCVLAKGKACPGEASGRKRENGRMA